MIDIQEKKRKIISFLETNGPSLPVRIAKAIQMDPIFTSAILSELLGSQQIKTSNMKIGASSLYLLSGQEQKLEEHTDNFKSGEKEAYSRLKEKELLIDEEEKPQIRVALRNIKDFATPFKFQEKIMWRYRFTPNEKIKELLTPKEEPIKEKPKKVEGNIIKREEETKEVPKAWEVKKEEIKKAKEESESAPTKDKNNLVRVKKIEGIFTPREKEEPDSEFLIEIKKFLKQKDIKFLEKIQANKKEIVAKVSLETKLGNINFLLIAKNKKTLTIDEINSSIQRATYDKMPCLLIIKKEPSKKIQNIINENHLIKLEILN